jgi:hypothetical protein
MSAAFVNNPAALKDGVEAGLAAARKFQASQGDTPPPTEKSTDVYFWYFGTDAKTESDKPLYSQSMPCTRDVKVGMETVVNTIDGRTKVAAADYSAASGKYRGMVKSLSCIELQSDLWFSHRQVVSPLRGTGYERGISR